MIFQIEDQKQFFLIIWKNKIFPILARFFENIVDSQRKKCTYTATEKLTKFNDFVKSNNFRVKYTSTKFGLNIKTYDDIVKRKTRKNIGIDNNFLNKNSF